MSVQPADSGESYEVIHLVGEAAAIVPLPELRRLRAVERHAPAEVFEDAEAQATLALHDEWVRAGRPVSGRTMTSWPSFSAGENRVDALGGGVRTSAIQALIADPAPQPLLGLAGTWHAARYA